MPQYTRRDAARPSSASLNRAGSSLVEIPPLLPRRFSGHFLPALRIGGSLRVVVSAVGYRSSDHPPPEFVSSPFSSLNPPLVILPNPRASAARSGVFLLFSPFPFSSGAKSDPLGRHICAPSNAAGGPRSSARARPLKFASGGR